MDTLSTQDRDHLRLLSIFHYVFAALGICGLGFIGLHFAIMRTAMTAAPANGADAPPEAFMHMMVWFYLLILLACITGMILNIIAARSLRARRRRTLCMVIAGLNMLQIPFGTVLGIFTILVLSRDSVRNAFDGGGGDA